MPLPISRLLIQHALLRPDLLSPSMLRERARTADALRILPTLSTRLAAALLDFASSDVMEDDPDSVCELFGLPVLPLLNGSLVAMRPPGQQSLFLPGPQEVELFQAAAHCLLDPNAINAEMVQR